MCISMDFHTEMFVKVNFATLQNYYQIFLRIASGSYPQDDSTKRNRSRFRRQIMAVRNVHTTMVEIHY